MEEGTITNAGYEARKNNDQRVRFKEHVERYTSAKAGVLLTGAAVRHSKRFCLSTGKMQKTIVKIKKQQKPKFAAEMKRAFCENDGYAIFNSVANFGFLGFYNGFLMLFPSI